jgi:hypothetical protein
MVAPIGFVLIISSVFEFLLSLKLPTTKTKKITDNESVFGGGIKSALGGE